jgi:sigma-B regulation protein RsbU (phosphoserine phosphatase)
MDIIGSPEKDMDVSAPSVFLNQLLDRRQKLEAAASTLPAAVDVQRLISEVDQALKRIELGTFGLCETCHDPIETDRLIADPVTRFCLDHLTPREQRALQQDLDLATRIQRELLPKADSVVDGWQIAYHYQAAGAVSGDYCDLLPGPRGDTYFLIGDVAGKGVAAAMLMSHLSAMLRTLISIGLPLPELMQRASRVFCESTLPTHYVTLVCGRASTSGELEICNAGHPPPLVIGRGEVTALSATALPIGMFCAEDFTCTTARLQAGDTMLLYTDGLIEAQNGAGADYGLERLRAFALAPLPDSPRAVVDACVRDLGRFLDSRQPADDVTIMALRRV